MDWEDAFKEPDPPHWLDSDFLYVLILVLLNVAALAAIAFLSP